MNKHEEFCAFLKGFFAIHDARHTDEKYRSLNAKEVKIIRTEFAKVYSPEPQQIEAPK